MSTDTIINIVFGSFATILAALSVLIAWLSFRNMRENSTALVIRGIYMKLDVFRFCKHISG